MNILKTKPGIAVLMAIFLIIPCHAESYHFNLQTEIDGLIYGVLVDNVGISFGTYVIKPADKNITAVNIPEEVTLSNGTKRQVIGVYDNAFQSCTRLTEVTFSSTVAHIRANAFQGCKALKSVTLPPNCQGIGAYAFADCTSLEEIKFSGTADAIGERAFQNTPITELILPETSANAKDGVLQLAASNVYNNYGVFQGHTFVDGCNNLKKIIIKADKIIVYNQNEIHITLDGLKLRDDIDVILRENVGLINDETSVSGDMLFDYEATAHTNAFRVPDSWLEDGNNIEREFEQDNIGYLLNHRLNQAIVIHHYTYRAVPEITIPQSVTFNGKSYTVVGVSDLALQGCKATKINLPSSVKYIGTGCFAACPTLETVALPETTTLYTSHAFYNSPALKEVELPSVGFERIQTNAFSGCSSLNRIKLPKGIKKIEYKAFTDCSNIKTVDIADITEWLDMDINYYGGDPLAPAGYGGAYSSKYNDWLAEGYALDNYGVDGFVTLLVDGKDASTLEIPEGVETIRHHALYRCENIKTLILPSSLKKVVRDAFVGCSGLETVVCKSMTAPATHNAIFNHEILDNALLIVDKNADHSYDVPNTTSIWYKFANCERRDTSDFSGIDKVSTEGDNEAPVEYYNLQGVRVNNPEKGIYIRRQGSTTSKIIL